MNLSRQPVPRDGGKDESEHSQSDDPQPTDDANHVYGKVNRLALALELASSTTDLRRQSETLSPGDLMRISQGRSLNVAASPGGVCMFGPRGNAYKNLLGVSLSFMACFSCFLGLLNLQATFNGELGLYTLVVMFAMWMLAAIISPSIIRVIGTKYAIVCGYVAFLIYTATNYHPDWVTLIPSSILLGFAFGPLWSSMLTHITTTAITYAPALNEIPSHLVPVFTGIFSFFTQCSQIFGNLVSSIILTTGAVSIPSNNFTNYESSSSNICNNTIDVQLPEFYRHILTSVYILFDIAGIVIASVMIDKLPVDVMFMSATQMFKVHFKHPVSEAVKTLFHWKSFLMMPMTALNGMILAYLSGRFAQVFISKCVGVQWVGFVIVSYGITSSFNSVITGRLVKYIPEHFFIYAALVMNIALMLFLIFWQRELSFAAVFVFAILWGVSVGVWNTLVPGIIGLLFADRQEAGFSVNRIWYAMGFTVGYLTSVLLSVSAQQWFYIAVMLVTFFSYSFLILLTRKRSELLPCCFSEATGSEGSASIKQSNENIDVTTDTPTQPSYTKRETQV